MRYAKKVKLDPRNSYVYNPNEIEESKFIFDETPLNNRDRIILSVICLCFIWLAYGVIAKGYYLYEIIAVFLIMGVVCGLIARLSLEQIADSFVSGAKDMVFTAICIGIAKAIVVILENGNIMDSVINVLASIVGLLPASVSAIGMLLVQTALNLFLHPVQAGSCYYAHHCPFRRFVRGYAPSFCAGLPVRRRDNQCNISNTVYAYSRYWHGRRLV